MTNAHDPNFPVGLQIRPLDTSDKFLESGWSFDASAQKDAIRKYGIAGRVWCADGKTHCRCPLNKLPDQGSRVCPQVVHQSPTRMVI